MYLLISEHDNWVQTHISLGDLRSFYNEDILEIISFYEGEVWKINPHKSIWEKVEYYV